MGLSITHNYDLNDGIQQKLSTSPFFSSISPLASSSSLEETEKLIESCQKLLDDNKYPYEMMPFMYVILKYTRVDLKTAEAWVKEGKLIVRFLTFFFREKFCFPASYVPDFPSPRQLFVERLTDDWLIYVIFFKPMSSFVSFQNLGQQVLNEHCHLHNLNIFAGNEVGGTRQCGW